MLQINLLRQQPDFVINRLKIKNFDATDLVSKILEIDTNRRNVQRQADDAQAELNKLAKEIGQLFKEGNAEKANLLKEETTKIKELSKEFGAELSKLEQEQHQLILTLPNLPHESVKPGRTADDNEIVATFGEIKSDDSLLPHWELTQKYNLIDFDLGSKITGAGFPVYRGKGAKLQRALIQYFLDKASENGYEEVQVPYLVNEASAYATGQLPDKDGQMYHAQTDNLYLIPTAEVPVTNIYRDVIVKTEELPLKNCAYSACFRREAGSYGKDVRGLNRLHQFDKVEIVQITHPEDSYKTLEVMKDYVASIIKELNLPFRILRLCGGDISFTSALTYDMEVYSKGQNRWLEVSSVSNFETFQTSRLKLRFKDKEGKMQFAHSLNGSALALPRIMAALIENNQTTDGINVPEVLHKYTNFTKIQ
ncbi:MAG: serine--tRNA ligase [Bacteroidales bacterium]|nr:serine--tRNA ligase [Bacteroidales bacterium]MDY0216631.1 serine--tRNA ligase [Bacteroidales bacterium]